MADKKNREFLCFVVDVGPHMHALLPDVEEYLVCAMEAKLLNKPTHEIALLLFGSTDTENAPHTEAEINGEQDQYMHISVQQEYRLPDVTTLKAASHLPRGMGYSDMLDALTVAADMVVKADAERILGKSPKRVVLISNFQGKGKGWDDDFRKHVADTFTAQFVKLEVLHLDYGAAPGGGAGGGPSTTQAQSSTLDPSTQAAVTENLDGISQLLQGMGGLDPMAIRSAAELAMAMRWVEVMPVSTYRGSLAIGKSVRVPVRAYKKVARETLPSLKDYYVTALPGAEANTGSTFKTMKVRSYNVEGKKDELVGEDDTAKGHKYGRQIIPVSDITEAAMKYSVPDRGMWLWGFMPASQVKRFSYMSESLIVVGDFNESGAREAVSTLVRAMHKDHQVAVVRYVARANSRPFLLVLSPMLGNMRRPDAWIANHLPFEQDIKWVDFPPLGTANGVTSEQKAAAEALVDSMQLTNGTGAGRELLAPEGTPNPVLKRFYVAIAQQAMHQAEQDFTLQIPSADADPLVQAVYAPPPAVLTSSEEARKRMRDVFKTTVVRKEPEEQDPSKRARSAFDEDEVIEEGAAGAAGGSGGAAALTVHHVGSAMPEDDFAALLAAGKVQAAMTEMAEVILLLVDDSVGSRNYDKAAGCEAALRRACVEHGMAEVYNKHLQGLVSHYKHHEAHSAFFSRLMAAQVTLISDLEAPEAAGAVSADEAAAFLRLHTAAAPAAAPPPPMAVEGDDFDEME